MARVLAVGTEEVVASLIGRTREPALSSSSIRPGGEHRAAPARRQRRRPPLLRLTHPTFTGATKLLKSALDRAGALLILVLISPVMLVLAVAVPRTAARCSSACSAWAATAASSG